MHKIECANRLKVQLFTFSTSFDIMWYASAAIYRKNLLLFHEVVSHVLVNETEGGDFEKKWHNVTWEEGGRSKYCTVSFYTIPTNHSEEFEQSRSIPAALKFTHQSEGDFRMKWQELMNHVFWITRSNCGQNVAILKKMNIFSATCGYWMSRHMEETEAENWLIYLVCM